MFTDDRYGSLTNLKSKLDLRTTKISVTSNQAQSRAAVATLNPTKNMTTKPQDLPRRRIREVHFDE